MRNLRLIKILSRIHPKSSVRKNLKFYLALQKNNNKIYIVESGKERELKPLENIKKLKLYFAGCNNIVKIHKGCQIKGLRVDIKGENNYLEIKPSQYELGALSWLVIEKGSKIILGKNLWVTSRLFMHAQGPNTEIVIGENCVFARETTIRNSDTHTIFRNTNKSELINPNKSVYIGNHVWITQKCTILKGVHLLDNSIVGTMSVVSKSLKMGNCIIAGNPAKVVKQDVNWDHLSAADYMIQISNK